MKLVQIYGDPGAPLAVECDGSTLAPVVARHKARQLEAFSNLTEDQWKSETRCEGWTALELGHHVTGAANFFAETLIRSQQGEATRFLEGFDPQESPKELAAAAAGMTPEDVLADMEHSITRLQQAFDAFAGDERGAPAWTSPAEAPPGQVPAHSSLQHCLFDSWLHERDLLLPLGLEQIQVAEEVIATTQYLCGLAAIAALLDLDPAPEPGETLRIGLTDHLATIEVDLGLPTRARVIHGADPEEADVVADGQYLCDAMSGRADLSAFVEPGSREHTILGGALKFLS
jgi:uncharacterized protein (TIGR03083 family)